MSSQHAQTQGSPKQDCHPDTHSASAQYQPPPPASVHGHCRSIRYCSPGSASKWTLALPLATCHACAPCQTFTWAEPSLSERARGTQGRTYTLESIDQDASCGCIIDVDHLVDSICGSTGRTCFGGADHGNDRSILALALP
jgi:hypothetical protein